MTLKHTIHMLIIYIIWPLNLYILYKVHFTVKSSVTRMCHTSDLKSIKRSSKHRRTFQNSKSPAAKKTHKCIFVYPT